MIQHPKSISFMIELLSLRTARDFLLKPAFALSTVLVTRFIVEFLMFGGLTNSFTAIVATSSVTMMPFLLPTFFVITYLDKTQDTLSTLALTDPLTKLPNRRAFLERTEWFVAAIQHPEKGVILLMDADRFKRINDNWGHPVGDLCLKLIAERLGTELRATDVAGRLGGEEFAVFLPGATLAHAVQLGQRLCRQIQLDSTDPPGRLVFTLSVGIATVSDRIPLEEAMKNADLALYQAKANGRARVEVWQEPRPPSSHVA